MKRKTGAGLSVLVFLSLLALVTFKTHINLFAFQSFRIDSKLLYIIGFSLALGAFLMFFFTAGMTRPVRELVLRTMRPASLRTILDELETAIPTGDYGRANEVLEEVFQDPNPPIRAWKLQGDYFRMRGDLAAAERSYGEYLNRCPGEQKGPALMLLGDLHEQQDLPDRAEDVYEEAQRIVPQASEPLFRLRRIAVQAGRWEAALSRQEQLELQFPDQLTDLVEQEMRIGIRYEVARKEWERASHKNAQALLKHISRLTDSFVPAYLLSGEIYEQTDNPSSALKIWEKGFRMTQHPSILQRIGDAFLSRNLPEKAIEFFYGAVPAFGENPFLDYCLAELYRKLDLKEHAHKRFELLAKRYPTWLPVQRITADFLAEAGRVDEAAEIYKRLLDSPGESCRLWVCSVCNSRETEYSGFCRTCLRWNSIQMNVNQAGKEAVVQIARPVSYAL